MRRGANNVGQQIRLAQRIQWAFTTFPDSASFAVLPASLMATNVSESLQGLIRKWALRLTVSQPNPM